MILKYHYFYHYFEEMKILITEVGVTTLIYIRSPLVGLVGRNLDFCQRLPKRIKRLMKELILLGEKNKQEYMFIIYNDLSVSDIFAGKDSAVQVPGDIGALFTDCLATFHNHHSYNGLLHSSFSTLDIVEDVEEGCRYSCIGFLKNGKPYLRCLEPPSDPDIYQDFIEEHREVAAEIFSLFRRLEKLAEESGLKDAREKPLEDVLRWAKQNRPQETGQIIKKLESLNKKKRGLEEGFCEVCEIPL